MTAGEGTILKYHPKQKYWTLFNPKNGFFARIEDDGAEEPSWAKDGPELLDIAITNFCERGCEFCYRSSSPTGKHMPVDDLLGILDQCKEIGVLQIALGGGNPNQHPEFIRILQEIRSRGIVPSYTTNGEGLTDEILQATKRYCGAMALSAYPPFEVMEEQIKRITDFGIRLNLHIILSEEMIGETKNWLEHTPEWVYKVNALIFLTYKPINPDYRFSKLTQETLKRFFNAVQGSKVKIGFDSCSMPRIVSYMDVAHEFIEPCEAAKFSAFISEDLKMYPCSFMAHTARYGDLRKVSIIDIWASNSAFIKMRSNKLAGRCKACSNNQECGGGCQFIPEINSCPHFAD